MSTPPQLSRTATIWLWLGWAIVTPVGWGIAIAISAIAFFSAGIYDPDEVEAFQRAGPGGMLINALIMGTIVGLVFAVPLGLYQWLREKRGLRQGLITAAITIALTVLACVAGSPGPVEVVGERTVAVSTGIAGGLVGGVWAGGLQYFLLRRSVRGYWVAATIVTWAIAWAGLIAVQPIEPAPGLGINASAPSAPAWLGLLVPLCGGGLIGLAQWLFLRRMLERATWWIPAWGLGWLLTSWLTDWVGVAGILALGIVTASVLVALLPASGQPLDKPAA